MRTIIKMSSKQRQHDVTTTVGLLLHFIQNIIFLINTSDAQDCQCQSPLAPGCECDPGSPNADDFCGVDERWPQTMLTCYDAVCRCLGNCQCKICPQSGSGEGNGQSPRNKVLNPPLTFVIDTTKSVKPDKDSIFNLTQKVVESIKIDSINIPRFTLVSFNDYGPDINKNVKVEVINILLHYRNFLLSMKLSSWHKIKITDWHPWRD